jgi:hypothetical protein
MWKEFELIKKKTNLPMKTAQDAHDAECIFGLFKV